MRKQLLSEQYPWYQRHATGINALARCLGIEVELLLRSLDPKTRAMHQAKSAQRERRKAA
jgi:hypothetical protein